MKKKLDDMDILVITHHDQDHANLPFALVEAEPMTVVPADSKRVTKRVYSQIIFYGGGKGTTVPPRKVRISRAPGWLLLFITEFIFFKKTQERVFIPIIQDMRQEYCDALQEGRIWKGRWILICYRISFVIALLERPVFDLLKLLLKTLKTN